MIHYKIVYFYVHQHSKEVEENKTESKSTNKQTNHACPLNFWILDGNCDLLHTLMRKPRVQVPTLKRGSRKE